MVGGAPPRGCIISVVPSGGAIGIMPFDESELVFPDEKSQVEKLSARENPASASLLTSSRAVPRAPSGALQRRLPRELLQLISQDEQKDFDFYCKGGQTDLKRKREESPNPSAPDKLSFLKRSKTDESKKKYLYR